MARRNNMLDFIHTFNQAFDTVNKVGKDYEMSKLANEKPTTAFTADQDTARTAMANAKDENGNPIYNFSADEQGNISTTLNKDAVPNAAPEAYAPQAMAQGGTTFLGKSYDAPLTGDQQEGARTMAMAGIMGKYGDAEGAMRLRRDVNRDAQSNQQFAWAKEQHDTDAADKKAMKDVDTQTSDWFKSRLKNPDGTDREATVDDHLAASQYRASALVQAGKQDAAGKVMAEHNSQAHIKIQLESAQRDQDLTKTASALAAGDLDAVKTFYNKYVPDGAKVTGVTRGENGQITVARETMDGQPMAPTVMKDAGQMVSALASFKDPMALYNWSQNEFRNNLALKADARAGAADGRASASFNEGRDDKKALRTAGVDYEKARQSGNKAGMNVAALDMIKAGGLNPGAASKDDPSEVRLARSALQAGVPGVKDMASALEWAKTKNGSSEAEVRRDIYGKALAANFGNAESAKAATDEAMKYLFTGASGGASAAKPVGEFGTAAEAEAAVKVGKIKPGDRVMIGGRAATAK